MLISTDVFTTVCEATAKIGGIPDIKWATVAHPIGSRTESELQSMAELATDQFVAIIVDRHC